VSKPLYIRAEVLKKYRKAKRELQRALDSLDKQMDRAYDILNTVEKARLRVEEARSILLPLADALIEVEE